MQPTDDEIAQWNRYFGSRANNRAWQLSELSQRTSEESEEMVRSAHTAFYHWQKVGNAKNRAHAEQLLAHVYALVGDAREARRYFERARAVFNGPEAEPWEVAITCAVAANVASACGEAAEHESQYRRAEALIAALPDEEERAILNATLNVVPKPSVA
jgi:hypothetical protein